ncbi:MULTISPECIES: hypothetical protein [Bacillus]|uniref:hypothetical protein n=1 Tax=Bacillus TaxID=1386 RepID=UPI000BB895E4|nr:MULTISPECIES: hypothetical protein [Bacillus]
MIKRFLSVFVFFSFILLLTSCNSQPEETLLKEEDLNEQTIQAKKHLEDMGYEVLSFDKEGWEEFKENRLSIKPNQDFWSVQNVDPTNFLNKKLDTYYFTIKNHPLDEIFNMGKTKVSVYMLDGEVFGGWSYPISEDNDVMGSVSSLEGLSAEEVQGDYQKWLLQWNAKYGN